MGHSRLFILAASSGSGLLILFSFISALFIINDINLLKNEIIIGVKDFKVKIFLYKYFVNKQSFILRLSQIKLGME